MEQILGTNEIKLGIGKYQKRFPFSGKEFPVEKSIEDIGEYGGSYAFARVLSILAHGTGRVRWARTASDDGGEWVVRRKKDTLTLYKTDGENDNHSEVKKVIDINIEQRTLKNIDHNFMTPRQEYTDDLYRFIITVAHTFEWSTTGEPTYVTTDKQYIRDTNQSGDYVGKYERDEYGRWKIDTTVHNEHLSFWETCYQDFTEYDVQSSAVHYWIGLADSEGKQWFYTSDNLRLNEKQFYSMTALDDPSKRFRAYATFYAPPKLVSRGGNAIIVGHSFKDVIRRYIYVVSFLTKGCASENDYEFDEDVLGQKDWRLREEFKDGKVDNYMNTPLAIFDMWESKDIPIVILKAPMDYCKNMLTTGIEFMLDNDYETIEDCEQALHNNILDSRLNGITEDGEGMWCGMAVSGDFRTVKDYDDDEKVIPPLISDWEDDGATLNFTKDGKTLEGELDLETLQNEHVPADTLEIIRIPITRENLIW